MMIHSFDVFDTVITRTFSRPKDLFAAMAVQLSRERFFEDGDWTDFSVLRVEAEMQARQITQLEDISIRTIYEALADRLNLDEYRLLELMNREIALEIASVRPVPAVLSAIKSSRQEALRIIFISDMYLPLEIIQEMLSSCGAFLPGDKLYLSSELGLTKATGNLFLHCLQEEDIIPGQLHHMGDNELSDIGRAEEVGIRSTYFAATELNRYENLIIEARDLASIHIRSLIAGASRLGRLDFQSGSIHQQTIWNTGASVAAPILVGFVTWLLCDAKRRGIGRIYFIARDGQILFRIAETICNSLDLGLDCRYLYGSRQAWHLPATMQVAEFEFDWILAQTDYLTLEMVFQRVGIEIDVVSDKLLTAGFNPEKTNKNLTSEERKRLNHLIKSGVLTQQILAQAEIARAPTLDYLDSAGLFDDEEFAIADIGWSGTLQRSLGNILAAGGKNKPINGYYFGLLQRLLPRPGDNLRSYFWDLERSSSRADLGFKLRVLMEIFTAADHGGVKGYRYTDSCASPVLSENANEAAIIWGVSQQQQAIMAFVANLEPETLLSLSHLAWLDVFQEILGAFFNSPSVEEAMAYGSYPVSEDQNNTRSIPFAQKFVVSDTWRALRRGTAEHHHNEWRQAAKILTPLSIYAAIRLAEKMVEAIPAN